MILSAQAASAIENARLFEEAQLAVVVKLMGDISHDVKNMVTPIAVCAQTLELMFESFFEDLDAMRAEVGEPLGERLGGLGEVLREFYPEAVGMFLDGADQVQARVREIADCVKGIVAEPNFEPTAINDVVHNVVSPLRLVAERADLHLEITELSPGLPLVPMDQKQMYNCIYNLINNAIPETPPGGKIYVRTRLGHDHDFADGAPHLVVQVGDTGKGMPEHVRAKLFTKDAVSTKPGGTGLGTKIVGNVVAAHGGRITVDSEEGVGTVFTLRFPLTRAEEA
jgi:signal transduction histidine kinase